MDSRTIKNIYDEKNLIGIKNIAYAWVLNTVNTNRFT